MKKLFWIVIASVVISCGEGRDNGREREAASDEPLEVQAGEESFPEVQLDSAKSGPEGDSLLPGARR